MRLGIVATLKQDGRGSSQGLQTRRISIAVRIIPNFSQQPGGKPFSSSGQAAKHLAVSVSQKKLLDHLVIASNLLNQRLQLLDEYQHQASFRSDSGGIGNQLWLVQGLEDLWGNRGRRGMTLLGVGFWKREKREAKKGRKTKKTSLSTTIRGTKSPQSLRKKKM